MPREEEITGENAPDQAEDEVDLLCTQILRRLNQLKQRKQADIALKALCDATVADLEEHLSEAKARCFKREIAAQTYTDCISETEVAFAKVVATADAVAAILNNDVANDDSLDIAPPHPEEIHLRGAKNAYQTAESSAYHSDKFAVAEREKRRRKGQKGASGVKREDQAHITNTHSEVGSQRGMKLSKLDARAGQLSKPETEYYHQQETGTY